MSVMRTVTRIAGMAVAVAALLSLSPAYAEGDAAKQLATAEAHAGFAVKAPDLAGVQMHLHHVVNCMVGPNGKDFDAAPGNPCKDQGAGVMPDFKGTKAKRRMMQKALDDARAGLKATDVAVARQKAADAETQLREAM
jgi:hypothetical protein